MPVWSEKDIFTPPPPKPKRKRGRPRVLHPKTCEKCGRSFMPAKQASRFCSRECAGLDKRKPVQKLKKLSCANCGAAFERRIAQTYCSHKCTGEARTKRAGAIRQPVPCLCCGKTMMLPPALHGVRLFCNMHCSGEMKSRMWERMRAEMTATLNKSPNPEELTNGR